MEMKKARAIGFAVAAVFAALWTIPLVRAFSFLRWALRYLREDMTVNASNDYNYSIWLIVYYGVSLFAAFAVAWFLSRRPRFVFLLPIIMISFAVIEVIWLNPEKPIHLFPTMLPWRPAIISLVAVAFSVLAAYVPCGKRDE